MLSGGTNMVRPFGWLTRSTGVDTCTVSPSMPTAISGLDDVTCSVVAVKR
jgi:hypothetical protein